MKAENTGGSFLIWNHFSFSRRKNRYVIALLVIAHLASFLIGGMGGCSYFSIGSFISMNPSIAITMMAVGGGLPFLVDFFLITSSCIKNKRPIPSTSTSPFMKLLFFNKEPSETFHAIPQDGRLRIPDNNSPYVIIIQLESQDIRDGALKQIDGFLNSSNSSVVVLTTQNPAERGKGWASGKTAPVNSGLLTEVSSSMYALLTQGWDGIPMEASTYKTPSGNEYECKKE